MSSQTFYPIKYFKNNHCYIDLGHDQEGKIPFPEMDYAYPYLNILNKFSIGENIPAILQEDGSYSLIKAIKNPYLTFENNHTPNSVYDSIVVNSNQIGIFISIQNILGLIPSVYNGEEIPNVNKGDHLQVVLISISHQQDKAIFEIYKDKKRLI